MPTIAIMRHGVALDLPYRGLTSGSCRQTIALTEAIAEIFNQEPLIICAEEREAKETANLVAVMFKTTFVVNRALSENGRPEEMDELICSLLKKTRLVIIVTHRKRTTPFLKSLMKISGKPLHKKPTFVPKLFEIVPRIILVNTETMETNTIRAKRHGK